MGATRALVTVRLPCGCMVYVHDRELAAGALGRAVPSAPVGTDSDLSQRLSVIEAGLRVQHEIEGPPASRCPRSRLPSGR